MSAPSIGGHPFGILSDTDLVRAVRALRAIDELHRTDPGAVCDTDVLVARLAWTRKEVQRGLFDARVAGFIVGRSVDYARVELTDIQLKPAGRAAIRWLPPEDDEHGSSST